MSERATCAGGRAGLRLGRLPGGPAAATSTPTTSPRASARRSSWSASRCAASTRPARSSVPDGLLTTDAAALGRPRRRRRRGRGHRRHRAGPDADPRRDGAGASVVTANKALLAEDGADAVRGRRQGAERRDLYYEAAVAGAIPILRPLRESLAGDRVTRVLGIVNGTTNFILDRMDTTGADFADALAEAQALGLRRGRPDRRRRGLRRRGEGGDPRRPRVPHPRDRRRRPPRGHHRGHRRRRRLGARDGPRHQAARHRRAARRRRRRRGGRRARAPGDDPAHPPAGQRARGLQRRLRRGRGGRPADVLRPRRRRCADRVGGARRPGRRSRATASAGTRGAGESTYADPRGAADRRDAHPLPRHARRRRPRRACWPRWRPPSPSTASRSRPCGRRAAAPTPSWSS